MVGREDSNLKQTHDGCGSRKEAAEPKACLLEVPDTVLGGEAVDSVCVVQGWSGELGGRPVITGVGYGPRDRILTSGAAHH